MLCIYLANIYVLGVRDPKQTKIKSLPSLNLHSFWDQSHQTNMSIMLKVRKTKQSEG